MKESEVIALLIKELEGYLEWCESQTIKLYPPYSPNERLTSPTLQGFTKYLRRKTSNE